MQGFLERMKEIGMRGTLVVNEHSENEWTVSYTLNRLEEIKYEDLRSVKISLNCLGVEEIRISQTTNGLKLTGYIKKK